MNNPFTFIHANLKSIYLIGICGTGMTALAGMLKSQGFEVTGSDQNIYPPMSVFLEEEGIPVLHGYDEKHLETPTDLVVIGNAISRGNPEVEFVLEEKLPYISLPFALKEFFIRGNYSCVVTGTHGKTTTSSLLSWVLESAGRDPSFFIGGIPENFGRGFKLGDGKIFVAEGDEYDSAFFDKMSKFLHYLPDLVILNNIEFDHADIFRNFDDVEIAFQRMINLIPRNGYLICNRDDAVVRKLSEKSFSNVITFGLDGDADWRAGRITTDEEATNFDAYFKNEFFGGFRIPLFGEHMIRNSLGVIAAGKVLGLDYTEIDQGLRSFKNVRRRLQFLGEKNNIKLFDDFAHHPTEVESTISALRERFPESRLWAIFEPRTSTSKRKIFEEKFVNALKIADNVIITPLYLAHKVPESERLSVENISSKLTDEHVSNWILPANEEMLTFLKNNVTANDVVLFMSNGDLNQIPVKLLSEI